MSLQYCCAFIKRNASKPTGFSSFRVSLGTRRRYWCRCWCDFFLLFQWLQLHYLTEDGCWAAIFKSWVFLGFFYPAARCVSSEGREMGSSDFAISRVQARRASDDWLRDFEGDSGRIFQSSTRCSIAHPSSVSGNLKEGKKK